MIFIRQIPEQNGLLESSRVVDVCLTTRMSPPPPQQPYCCTWWTPEITSWFGCWVNVHLIFLTKRFHLARLLLRPRQGLLGTINVSPKILPNNCCEEGCGCAILCASSWIKRFLISSDSNFVGPGRSLFLLVYQNVPPMLTVAPLLPVTLWYHL